MPLKLMYITNDPEVAQIAQEAGVDRIFLDMEYIGKADRQGGMNTVQSYHTVKDIRSVRKVLTDSELLVRINPIHEQGEYQGLPHESSEDEINAVIEAGAEIIMLPYFKTMEEVESFIRLVDGRARTMLLLETVEATDILTKILQLEGIDEIHIGLNDLSLQSGKRFMFELLADGTVERLCHIMADHGMTYGFGGIAAPGEGMLPAEYIIRDHYHYGSSCVILSRSFCNCDEVSDIENIREIFQNGVRAIRRVEDECINYNQKDFVKNHGELKEKVRMIVEHITQKK